MFIVLNKVQRYRNVFELVFLIYGGLYEELYEQNRKQQRGKWPKYTVVLL